MKKIKTYNTFINESLKDKLKGKTDEEILDKSKKLYPEEKFLKGVRHGVLLLVKQAIEEGIDPSNDDNYAIRYASMKGHLNIIKYLLKDKRIDPTVWENWSIRLASLYNNLDIVKELLKDNRVRNKLSEEELNKYQEQISNLNESLRDKLKGKSENEILTNVENLSPKKKLFNGVEYGVLPLVKKAIEEGVDPSDYNNEAIIFASYKGYLDIVKYLLKDKRVDPSYDFNYTIRAASEKGHLDIIKELMKDKRVDPSDNNDDAIKIAFYNGYYDVVKELLKDKRVRNKLSEEELEKYKKQISNLNESLKTQKGSVIKRYKDVGKKMGNDLYFHKQYVNEYIDTDFYNKLKSYLPKDFKFNIIKYNNKDNYISFINSPDFDTADEPIVSDVYKVTEDGKVSLTREKSIPQIYHHKWLFVKDDYKGFDVEESKRRSEKWLKHTDKFNMSKIGSKKYWEEEAIPLFESIRDKLKGKSEEEILNNVKNLTSVEKLKKGVRYGILSLVKQSIEEGVDPSGFRNYAIRLASLYNNLNVVKYLLKDRRVDPSDYNNELIRYASEDGYLNIVKELLKDDRVDPSSVNNYAIKMASSNGHLDVVKELLKDERVRNILSEEDLKKYKNFVGFKTDESI